MIQLSSKQTTLLFSILHFLVDGICALIIFSSLYSSDYTRTLTVFLVYNFLAFLTQPLIGLWIDRFNNPKIFLLVSVIFILLGIIFKWNFVISAISLGIGNSIFHISSGKYVIEKSKNNIISLGLFVGTGAFGLALGQRYYSFPMMVVFLIALVVISFFIILTKQKEEPAVYSKTNHKRESIVWLVFLIALVVTIRSFVGKIIVFDFVVTDLFFLCLGLASMVGKFLGGVLAKYVGVVKTMVITMLGSILCLCFYYQNPYLIILGTLLFNCSMPITLWYINEVLRKREGFAFGLLAFSLIPGYLLGMLEYDMRVKLIAIGLLCIASLGIIIFVNKRVSDASV